MVYVPKKKKPRPLRKRPKYCPRCEEIKPPYHFSKSDHQWDGLQIWCKACFADLYQIRMGRKAPPPKTKERGWVNKWTDTWYDD